MREQNNLSKIINQVIRKAVNFIYVSQGTNGIFPTMTSSNADFSNATKCESNFATALISLCINEIENDKTVLVRKRINEYLLSEKSDYWTFNYWSRKTDRYKSMPYPDDLDDTSCALAALYSTDSDIFDGAVIAKISQVLIRNESAIGGPYKTWLVKPDSNIVWQDVDPAVNANIAYFLSLLDVKLPKINKYIIDLLKGDSLSSPYYPTEYPIYYFISRFYKGKFKKVIIDKLFGLRERKKINNPLDMALFVSTCLNLKHLYPEIENDIEYIIANQKINGSFAPYAFYAGINPTKMRAQYFEGSAELTSAFCVESMHKYNQTMVQKNNSNDRKDISVEIKQKIISEFCISLSSFDPNFRSTADKLLLKITSCNVGNQILLLPFYFQQSLCKKSSEKEDDLIVKLGLANLLGWVAYTIYDDFFDNEGNPQLLPLANVCLRKLTSLFSSQLDINGFCSEVFAPFMNRLDRSNFWEVINCNLEIQNSIIKVKDIDFGKNAINIAEKSIGHLLGPLCILYFIGIKKDSANFRNTERFLTHYIVAKQLNDDAHDWEEDLVLGKITSVLNILFKDYSRDKVNLKDTTKMKEIFWRKTILQICNLIEYHLTESKKALNQLDIIVDKTVFMGLIHELESIKLDTLKQRQDTLDFITHFQK